MLNIKFDISSFISCLVHDSTLIDYLIEEDKHYLVYNSVRTSIEDFSSYLRYEIAQSIFVSSKYKS